MRRPLSHALAAALLLAATAATATPAAAQRSRIVRRAFDPSVTVLLGTSIFGERTTALEGGASFDYNNGLVLGVQFDRPLTRRTALMGTVTVAPLSRVAATVQEAVGELDRTLIAGLDLGFAARIKPAAPLFAYVGGGGVLATKRAAGDTDGTAFDPRVTGGLGVDLLRSERTGLRIMYLAHVVFPSTPDAATWEAKSTTLDHTIVLGGRVTLGWGREAQ